MKIAASENANECQNARQNASAPSTSRKFARPTQSVGEPTPSQLKNAYHQLAIIGQTVKPPNSSTSGTRNR